MTPTDTKSPAITPPGPLIAVLADRGVVRVSGADARKLLDGLVTNDVDRLAGMPVIHAGLLAPQGKILFAMNLFAEGDGLLIDVRREAVADLIKRLTMYRLRANVAFEDLSDQVSVAVQWNGLVDVPAGVLGGSDPRAEGLGQRLILPRARLAEIPATLVEPALWHDRRIALGVAEEGQDYQAGDTFPHEANYDRTGSVDFGKGCFVGQEVVSRMQHKTVVRKRVIKIDALDPAARLAPGSEIGITGGPAAVGTIGSVASDGRSGLALVKLDRIADALDKGATLTAGSGADATAIAVDAAALARYRQAAAARDAKGNST